MAKLIYRAGFNRTVELPHDYQPDNLPAVLDCESLGPLQRIDSPIQPGSDDFEPSPYGSSKSRLKLTLTRTQPPDNSGTDSSNTIDDCFVGAAVVGTVPSSLRIFRVRTTFGMANFTPDPSVPYTGYLWASTVFGREKSPVENTILSLPTRNQRITITLSSSDSNSQLTSRQNTPGGAPPGTATGAPPGEPPKFLGNAGRAPAPIPEAIRADIYGSLDPLASRFMLEMFVDRDAGIAQTTLVHFGKLSRDGVIDRLTSRRWFIHALTLNSDAVIDTLGFVIAIAEGHGTATIEVHNFEIDRLTWFDSFIIRNFSFLAPWLIGPGRDPLSSNRGG